MVPDLVGFQTMECREHIVREQIVNRRNGIPPGFGCRDSNIAPIHFAVKSAFRMRFEFKRPSEPLCFFVHHSPVLNHRFQRAHRPPDPFGAQPDKEWRRTIKVLQRPPTLPLDVGGGV
jgi:hypothetical protein